MLNRSLEMECVIDKSHVDPVFAREVSEGFSRSVKSIPSRWLYDAEGSRLFTEITKLDEYDLTRIETSILTKSSSSLASQLQGAKWKVVELGAGDGSKTEIILRALVDARIDFEYCPIDVSATALEILCSRMTHSIPSLACHSLIGDNLEGLGRLGAARTEGEKILLLDLGSSIGNRSREALQQLVSEVRAHLEEGDMVFTGFDLVKDSERMRLAYDDARGVTRDFNLNLLERMNRELGADFDVSAFKHEATWNPAIGGMESWLVSLRDQSVRIAALGREFHFQKWEPIQTETSLKFRRDQIEELAEKNAYESVALYADRTDSFVDALWLAKTKTRSAINGTRSSLH